MPSGTPGAFTQKVASSKRTAYSTKPQAPKEKEEKKVIRGGYSTGSSGGGVPVQGPVRPIEPVVMAEQAKGRPGAFEQKFARAERTAFSKGFGEAPISPKMNFPPSKFGGEGVEAPKTLAESVGKARLVTQVLPVGFYFGQAGGVRVLSEEGRYPEVGSKRVIVETPVKKYVYVSDFTQKGFGPGFGVEAPVGSTVMVTEKPKELPPGVLTKESPFRFKPESLRPGEVAELGYSIITGGPSSAVLAYEGIKAKRVVERQAERPGVEGRIAMELLSARRGAMVGVPLGAGLGALAAAGGTAGGVLLTVGGVSYLGYEGYRTYKQGGFLPGEFGSLAGGVAGFSVGAGAVGGVKPSAKVQELNTRMVEGVKDFIKLPRSELPLSEAEVSSVVRVVEPGRAETTTMLRVIPKPPKPVETARPSSFDIGGVRVKAKDLLLKEVLKPVPEGSYPVSGVIGKVGLISRKGPVVLSHLETGRFEGALVISGKKFRLFSYGESGVKSTTYLGEFDKMFGIPKLGKQGIVFETAGKSFEVGPEVDLGVIRKTYSLLKVGDVVKPEPPSPQKIITRVVVPRPGKPSGSSLPFEQPPYKKPEPYSGRTLITSGAFPERPISGGVLVEEQVSRPDDVVVAYLKERGLRLPSLKPISGLVMESSAFMPESVVSVAPISGLVMESSAFMPESVVSVAAFDVSKSGVVPVSSIRVGVSGRRGFATKPLEGLRPKVDVTPVVVPDEGYKIRQDEIIEEFIRPVEEPPVQAQRGYIGLLPLPKGRGGLFIPGFGLPGLGGVAVKPKRRVRGKGKRPYRYTPDVYNIIGGELGVRLPRIGKAPSMALSGLELRPLVGKKVKKKTKKRRRKK